MKKKIHDYISDIEQDIADDEEFDENEDPLADVRDNRRGSLLSARNIAIALVAMIVVFFAGYFAAFTMAHEKYRRTEAELAACRSNIESGRKEISSLKDSVDVLNSRLEAQAALLQPDTLLNPAGRTQK